MNVELGEEMSVPPDWATRPTQLQTGYECFERDGLRFYHHVNGLFILFLSRTHPVLQHERRDSLAVDYTTEARRSMRVEGKKRKGAPRTQPDTVIATLVLDDGTRYPLAAGIKGFVVEINERLLERPAALLDPDNESCYLAVLQPKSDFVSLASFKPGMMEEAKNRRARKKQKVKEGSAS